MLLIGARTQLTMYTQLAPGGIYSVDVTFAGATLEMVVSGPKGFHEVVPGRLDRQGVLLQFFTPRLGTFPAQFVSVTGKSKGY